MTRRAQQGDGQHNGGGTGDGHREDDDRYAADSNGDRDAAAENDHDPLRGRL
jgi:hypothetical protein